MGLAGKIAVGFVLLLILPPLAGAAEIDWKKVDAALGKTGAAQPGGVYKYGFPRSDLHVMLDGVEIKPALALGGWLAFQPMGDQAMVMGDLVLTADEVNPVLSKLEAAGISVTAIHNHLLRASPMTFYMHVGGEGDPEKLAAALHEALSASKTPFSPPGSAPATPAAAQPIDLDTAALDQALGAKGKPNSGVYQFSIPRADTIKEGGMTIPPAMGTAIGINFQPTGGGKAAITGDFVLVAAEVNPVMRALRSNGIEVTAVHNHMLDDQPRLFFLHFWANDDVGKLAKGLKAALDKVNIAKS
jgi:hypothetical protein